ncbi:hypothetical protein BX616_007599 [Lobosporangium transversale]|uniref:Kinase-like domain-containing protein n=1 Tax=Lobosporangium transversale TaxID=64571 RepID=A0A1Y2G633_9FUNG|nr:kinase-like domain-containing protein [Lobosporangium transversale]KAF9918585.1 hypothetical protein BX616_007599 [Lobosporangium transversale]ORY96977.1 kinase-like domain-containing protein [Lobosporangium transversale]|eukprot:XP_021875539.1 kinase-like domain-containing protein [Lobosporangium transversale]
MGNPLSKCCAQDTTLPKKTGDAPMNASNQSLISDSRVEPAAPVATKENNQSPNFFQRISRQFSVGQKSQSIEQGLQNFPYPLTEEEKQVLLRNEIPATEIKKLSIGVDAGGMGIIHVAEWKGQKVAIKEASAHVISKEVEIYSRMKGCDSVVAFYGVTFPAGLDKMCIVTKYADKGSLTWHLKVEYHKLTWDDKLRLGAQITKGIARLHEEGVYHRDLHGGNILIDDQGNAMLTDFGASTIMEERVVRNIKEYSLEEVPVGEGRSKFISKKITGLDAHQSGEDRKTNGKGEDADDDPLIGVMAYIAPERFRNPKYFDAKCDIYSLGVLLWELTSGHSAFAKVPQDVHLAVAIMNGKRELPVEGTPTEYMALYEKCWQSDPAKRPTTNEILETLAKVRASMTPEQLAVTRKRSNVQYESVEVYEESVSIPRPTSDVQQYFISE